MIEVMMDENIFKIELLLTWCALIHTKGSQSRASILCIENEQQIRDSIADDRTR